MRLRSATIRNYRIHREVHVDFDERRTLIGGPNESGKSTFIEAVHRALFLRAKTGGETQKQMVSEFGGQPEVAVTFTCGSKEYRILKRFSGPSGTVTFTETNGATWNGDEAEARLAELLNVECVGGGRGAGDRAAQQWAHLWVWQGHAGNDPSDHATEQRESLLSRLQSSNGGGAAIMQSDLDVGVAKSFATRYEELFNKNGGPKAGTELSRAAEDEGRAKEKWNAAQAKLAELQEAMDQFENAQEEIAAVTQTLGKLQEQKADADKKLGLLSQLQSAEKTQVISAESLAEKLKTLQDADRQIASLRAEVTRRTVDYAARSKDGERLAALEAAAKKQQREAEEECKSVTRAFRAAQQRHDAAAAYAGSFEKRKACDQLKQRLEQVRSLTEEMRSWEGKLAALPAVSIGKLKSLTKLETERGKAEAAVTAMAAGIQVISTDEVIKVGDAVLPVGAKRVITEDMELLIGEGTRIRISPGGGTNLADARNKLRDATEALQRELDALGVKSITEATEASTQRDHAAAEIRIRKARMESCGGDTVAQEFADLEAAVKAGEADAERRAALVEGFVAPRDEAAALTMLADITSNLRDLEARERAAEAALEGVRRKLEEAARMVAEDRQQTEKERETITGLDAQVRLLLDTHGTDETRGAQLKDLTLVSHEAGRALASTRHSIAALQPDLLHREHERIERSLQQNIQARNSAETNRAVAQSFLCNEGSDDPREALALAEAGYLAAVERTNVARRGAEATKLLASLFAAEQRALAQQYTQPLAEKVSTYLQCLFGADAQVQMTLEGHRFTGLRITRAGEATGAMPFSALSGGTREQVAAAVRLGMAEILASKHDNALPVVFDDAFAYADPARVQVLQRMLDLAAHRGLQVIVLTCTPSDYAGLGARTVSISRDPSIGRSSSHVDSGSAKVGQLE